MSNGDGLCVLYAARRSRPTGCVKGAGKHFSRIQGEGQCRIDKKGREPKS